MGKKIMLPHWTIAITLRKANEWIWPGLVFSKKKMAWLPANEINVHVTKHNQTSFLCGLAARERRTKLADIAAEKLGQWQPVVAGASQATSRSSSGSTYHHQARARQNYLCQVTLMTLASDHRTVKFATVTGVSTSMNELLFLFECVHVCVSAYLCTRYNIS